jgi:proteasome lid subunit RPN8/RPN11
MGLNRGDKGKLDAGRDLGCIAGGDWPFRDLPGPPPAGAPILVKQSVLNAIYEHGQSRTDVEVCGVLVGGVYRGRHGPCVYVEAMIQGVSAGSAVAQVTFTSATWDYIQDKLDKLYPHLRIIGWYHTHPGFGVFLSDMDLFIHNNFFSAPEQLALVYDPLSRDQGMFVWRRGETSREEFGVEEDVAAQPPAPEVRRLDTAPDPASASQIEELQAQVARLQGKLRLAVVAFVVVLVLAVAGPVAAYWLAGRNAAIDGPRDKTPPHGSERPDAVSEDRRESGGGNPLQSAAGRDPAKDPRAGISAEPASKPAAQPKQEAHPAGGSAGSLPPKPSDPPKEPK